MIILLVQLTGMKFLFGLGNPGEKYCQSRHNVGFMVIEELAQKLAAGSFTVKDKFASQVAKKGETLLVKPQTYMNQSGQAVRAILDFYQIEVSSSLTNLYVIHDDLDIELGKYKLQFGKGPKVHHGLQSIYQHLKTDQFWHLRVGIDGRVGDRSMPGEAYVLQNFSPAEKDQLSQTVSQIALELVAQLV